MIDLKQETKLRFVKKDYGKYEIQFQHPEKQEWWALPDSTAAIHAKWSFEKKGSYGSYNLHTFKIEPNSIDWYRTEFKTLGDIQRWFDKMNEKYESFKRYVAAQNAMPDIIE